jgi:iron complex outermembrane receptor protein
LVIGKLSYPIKIKSSLLNISAGVDNLLNQTYSLGNDINAFGGRYFNAAAKRNYFVGLQIKI